MQQYPSPAVQGFTLIELLITLAIISLLSAIAYPSYEDYSRRSKLSEALTQLADLRLQQEQYYQDNRSYLKEGTADECAVIARSNDNFTFSCSEATNTTFTWTAKSKSGIGLGDAEAFQYSIDQDGTQKTLAFDGASSTYICWQVNGSGC